MPTCVFVHYSSHEKVKSTPEAMNLSWLCLALTNAMRQK